MSTVERFFSQVQYSDDCWEWQGCKTEKGYGQFSTKVDGKHKLVRSHRWSYEYFVGPLGKLNCCHHCDNPKCINPFHLFAGTQRENIYDGVEKGRIDLSVLTPQRNQTHCKYGHKFTKENTYIRPEGHRECRICKKNRKRKSRTWRSTL